MKKFKAPVVATLLFSFWLPVVGWLTLRPNVAHEAWWIWMVVVQGALILVIWLLAAGSK